MKILVTGAAGFIGSHLSLRLLARGDQVTGIDNLNDYYDVTLKEARLARLARQPGFAFRRQDIADRAAMQDIFAGERFDCVVNLAAQAGVRYSLVNPHAYVDANVTGFLNILEGVRHRGGTSCSPLRARFMGATRSCRSARRIRWTTPCPSMRPPSGPTS